MKAVWFMLLLGIAIMATTTEQATADEKKDPAKEESWNEKVTVRRSVNGTPSTSALKDVPAFRYEKDGVIKFYTKNRTAGIPNVGAELTDEKGDIFIVQKVLEGTQFHISTVKPKAK